MTTTVAKVLADARNFLMSSQRDTFNVLTSDINTSVTTVSVNLDASLWTSGSAIEIDLEVMLVTAVSSSTLTVIRGMNGTAAASHTNGALIRLNPVFFDSMLLVQLNGELLDLCSPFNGLFAEKYVDVTYNASRRGYDLTSSTTVEDILDVRYATSGSDKDYPRPSFEFARHMPTGDFASGNAIFIERGGYPGRTVRVFYKGPYTPVTALTDTLESTAGMHAEGVDIPAVGTAIRATVGREVARNMYEFQGDTRRASEVNPGANNQAAAGLRTLRQQRIQAEMSRLNARWPGVAKQR